MTAPPPPGWYPDPSGAPRQRYFDGREWAPVPPPPRQPQAPATPDTDPAAGAGPSGLQGNEPTLGIHPETDANDNSDKNSAAAEEQSRSRWRSKLRAAVPTKSTAIIVTALVGFLFGIASNQVSDYLKQASNCSDVLRQFSVDAASNFVGLVEERHIPNATVDQTNDANSKYTTFIAVPISKVRNSCPVDDGDPQYLNKDKVQKFTQNVEAMYDCFTADQCSDDDASTYQTDASNAATDLANNAASVSQWGLIRRAGYAIWHIY